MNNAASIKDRLRNESIETGKTVQELLTAYGLERTILDPYSGKNHCPRCRTDNSCKTGIMAEHMVYWSCLTGSMTE